MTTKQAKALLIGINGFGRTHLNELLKQREAGLLELAAVSDLKISEEVAAMLDEAGIRRYTDYREMLAAEKGADFAIVSTPIQLHAPMSIEAMEAGYHVLLEKPPATALHEVERIAETVRRTGKLCAVNFYTPSRKALALIRDTVTSGRIGAVRSIKAISMLKRVSAYFQRTPWAGKLSMNGVPVLDGTFHNPAAHLLYSLLKVSEILSEAAGRLTQPEQVTAELYHANPIDSDDTSCMRIRMDDGSQLHLYITLCSQGGGTQRIRIEGESGALEWRYDDTVTIWSDGQAEEHDCREGGFIERRYKNLIAVMNGAEPQLDVALESAKRFTAVANGAFESARVVHAVPASYVRQPETENDPGAYIEGIEDTMRNAFEQEKLFSELGVAWAKASEPLNLSQIGQFPHRFQL